jgi:hypothetical protein
LVVRATAADAPPIPDLASGSVVVTNPPPPDYTASFDPGIPWSGQISTAMSVTGTCQVTIQNIAANAGHQNVTWSVYLSTNPILDGGDTLLSQATFGPMAGSSSTTVSFSGSWPATAGTFYFIVDIAATDDGNLANNTVTAQHFSVTGNYRYKEVEPNGGTGPGPSPISPADDTGVAALKANETLVIEGTMDAFGNYDTYSFTTDVSMTRLNIQALWFTGFDDIDLYLWDTGSTNLVTQTTGIDSEPGAATWKISSVTPRTCYISAYAYLANNTSGSVGKTYVIVVTGKP